MSFDTRNHPEKVKKERSPYATATITVATIATAAALAWLAYKPIAAIGNAVGEWVSDKPEASAPAKPGKTLESTVAENKTEESVPRLSFVDPTLQYDTLKTVSGPKGYEHMLKVGEHEKEFYQKIQLNDSTILEITTKYEQDNIMGSKFKMHQNGAVSSGSVVFDPTKPMLAQFSDYLNSIKEVVGDNDKELTNKLQTYLVTAKARSDASGIVEGIGNDYDNGTQFLMDFSYFIHNNIVMHN